jgi:transcriptional regulator with XRE-family HTH domain
MRDGLPESSSRLRDGLDVKAERRGIGEKLHELRKSKRLTLAELSKRSGYSVSALSKMENERLGITYDKLTNLAAALDVDISSLFTDAAQGEAPTAVGRRSVARKGSGKVVSTVLYNHLYISPELSNKRMVPILVKIQATSLEEFGPLMRHGGEEWIYVLKGEVEVHSEFYEPERLAVGDSIYLDNRMGHAYISKSKSGAEVLAVCSASAAELVAYTESKAKLLNAKPPTVATSGRRGKTR